MAYAFNGTNQWMSTSSAPVTNIPFSMSARFKKTGAAVKNGLFLRQSTTALAGFYFGSGQTVRGYFQTGAIADWSLGTYTTGQDTHVCITASTTTSRAGYLAGGSAVTDTTAVTLPNMTSLHIGVFDGVAPFFDGELSEIAVWNEALTQSEVDALAKGAAAYLVRPHALRFYAPMIRDLTDIRGGLAITNTNSATVTTHPRVYR